MILVGGEEGREERGEGRGRKRRGGEGKRRGREGGKRRAHKLLFNQGPLQPCYATAEESLLH